MKFSVLIATVACAFAASGNILELEKKAERAESLGRIKEAVGLYLKAASLREKHLSALEKLESRRKNTEESILSGDLDIELSDEPEGEISPDSTLDDSLDVRALAQISESEYRIGYDYLHSQKTNVAEKYFAKADKTTRKLMKIAKKTDDKALMKTAVARIFEIRVNKKSYEAPSDVPGGREGADIWLNELEILRRRGAFDDALAAGERAFKLFPSVDSIKKILSARDNMPGKDSIIAWLGTLAEDARFSQKERMEILNILGAYAAAKFRPEVVEKTAERLKKAGAKVGAWVKILGEYRQFAKFPRPESEIVFPKGLADFGVSAKEKTVYAANYLDLDDEEGSDMTKAIQDALDTPGVTTVVIGKLDKPWRITSVRIPSNRRIVLEKGAVIIGEELSRTVAKADKDMFVISKASNIVIEGMGDRPQDCHIGKFATREERRKKGNKYGGSALGIEGSNVLVKNISLSFNNSDGCCIGGQFSPSRELWFDNVVFDGNYRQGMSVINARGMYLRKCVFSNTDGNAPMAGVDFEPVYPSEYINEIYFMDCVFSKNGGGGLLVAASSYHPVSVSLRRCVFEAQPNSGVVTTARTTLYTSAEKPALGLLHFENSVLCRWMGQGAVNFLGCPLFDMKFVGCEVKITDNRPRGSVKDLENPFTTNTVWGPVWAQWREYPFKAKVDCSGLK